MLTTVGVRTRRGDLLSLSLDDDESEILVEDIDGLDPVKATLVSTSFAGRNGEQFQSSKRGSRNVKMVLRMEPDRLTSTVRELRQKLYNFFSPEMEVVLSFQMEDGLLVEIKGVVEEAPSKMFAQNPKMNVSIMCFESDFYDPVPKTVPGFLTSDVVPKNIDYSGSLKTGIKIGLQVNRSLPEFTVYHTLPSGEVMTMDFVAPLVAGDLLSISTVPGNKGAIVNRGGTLISLLYGVSPQSRWFELEPGQNKLQIYADGVGVPATVEYTDLYGGL